MTEILVRMARDENDIGAARQLSQEWLDWHWKNYPTDWPTGNDHPMDPEKFQVILEDLPQLHARPLGGILIATVDGKSAGCVMYNQAGPGVAEFNRMFVSETGRGNGIGHLLLERMFEQLIVDGYEKVFFASATFLTHARKMYEDAGFVDMTHPPSTPDVWRDKIYFMERALV